ncbi:ABC transporter permease [Leptospira sp. GIMC2001]|uniref:ABC transporter permease n=1 Tax=Leptospira sp. GIMC2001 TaxID=1513297 RepID=UPI00234BA2E3|nr:ABC transporter permease [Leptospira sp. GIMC2001]WCL50276.1 ABC transporter permease [Leptospira sp. GIMC2001]
MVSESMSLSYLRIIWVLVRRDYALQYAGSFLGITWMLLQNLTLIFIYAFVFLFSNLRNPGTQADYSGYVFSGLLFWIPLQELLTRGTSIITDNRQLIKRSSLGMDIFLWVPYFQYLIHFFATAIPIVILLQYYSSVNWVGLIVAFVWMGFIGLYVMLLINYLSRLNIIMKDISPLVRLLSQILFWTLPILYYPNGILGTINSFHPFNIPLDIFRSLILESYTSPFVFYSFIPFLLVFFMIWYFSRNRFHKVVLDQL